MIDSCLQISSIGKVRHNARLESASGVRKAHNMQYYVRKAVLIANTGVRKIGYVTCGFSTIKIHLSDYLKSLISRINEV